MPKTTIQIVTMMCPTGLGNPNASCRFHRASDNLTPDGMCPNCRLPLVKSTDPQDKMTKTVMGEEDIEPEILKDDEEKTKEGKAKMTNQQKEAYRTKRKADIVSAISEARKLEDK